MSQQTVSSVQPKRSGPAPDPVAYVSSKAARTKGDLEGMLTPRSRTQGSTRGGAPAGPGRRGLLGTVRSSMTRRKA